MQLFRQSYSQTRSIIFKISTSVECCSSFPVQTIRRQVTGWFNWQQVIWKSDESYHQDQHIEYDSREDKAVPLRCHWRFCTCKFCIIGRVFLWNASLVDISRQTHRLEVLKALQACYITAISHVSGTWLTRFGPTVSSKNAHRLRKIRFWVVLSFWFELRWCKNNHPIPNNKSFRGGTGNGDRAFPKVMVVRRFRHMRRNGGSVAFRASSRRDNCSMLLRYA